MALPASWAHLVQVVIVIGLLALGARRSRLEAFPAFRAIGLAQAQHAPRVAEQAKLLLIGQERACLASLAAWGFSVGVDALEAHLRYWVAQLAFLVNQAVTFQLRADPIHE